MSKHLNSQFTPNALRLAIFHAVPAWRRLRHLQQVPNLSGEYILALSRALTLIYRAAV